MDMMMPELNGQDATEALRARESHMGVTAMHMHMPVVGISCAHPSSQIINQLEEPEQAGQRDRGHPARRPAADDHYPVDLLRSRGHAQAITSVAKTDNCAG